MTTRGFLRHALMASLFLGLGFSLFIISSRDSEATPFTPTYTVCFDSDLTVACEGDSSAHVSSDIKSVLTVQAPDYNFAALVGFTPPQFGVAKGADIPVGAEVGKLNSVATLGLINTACIVNIVPAFTFLNGSLNTADTIIPLVPGTTNRLSNIAADVNPANGLPDGADKYPSWLNNIFRTNQADPSSVITPRARLFAATFLTEAQTDVILNILVFEPGQTIDPPGPQPPITFDPALGYPSVTVLQTLGDITEAPSPQPITDFCTLLKTTFITYGKTKDNPNTAAANEGGLTWRSNPPAGSYNFVNYFVTQRDSDEDGYENGLDPCPLSADPNWDPRTAGGKVAGADDEGDGIPNSCDENPNSPLGVLDTDADGYLNRGDNCPQKTNGIDSNTKNIIGPNNQLDSDLDGLGDECDANPQTPEGHRHEICQSATVSVGGGGGTPVPAVTDQCPEAAGGVTTTTTTAVDTDGDGVADATDRCANTPAGATVDQFGCTAAQAVLDDDQDAVLNAADKCPGTAAGASVDANGCSAAQLADTGGSDTGGVGDTGVGALAPAVASIPGWAAIASGLGGAGLASALGSILLRVFRRRRS